MPYADDERRRENVRRYHRDPANRETVERAKANDPRTLRAQLDAAEEELERLRAVEVSVERAAEPERIFVPDRGPERRVLDALAWWEAVGVEHVARARLAFVAGYHERTKSFLNALGTLRSAGRIDYPEQGVVALTAEGRRLADAPATAPTQRELHRLVYDQIGANRTRILQPLVEAYPGGMARADLAAQLGYHERTKSFLNGLGKLSGLGLIEYPAAGQVRATQLLFPTMRRAAVR